jgi:hypothetical protein
VVNRGVLAFGVLAVYLVGSVHLLRLDESIANSLVGEDGPFEWLGAMSLLVGSVLVVLALRRLRARGRAGRLKTLSYIALALMLFVAAGEEISWGQRVLGIETPEAVREVNAQGETNLHNLYGDENGQNASVLIYQVFWMGFGILLPLLALWRPLGRQLRRYLPVVPAWLALLFIGQQLLWTPIRAEFRADPGAWNATYRAQIGGEPFRVETVEEMRERAVRTPAGFVEIMEANIQVLLGAGALCLFLQAGRELPVGARRRLRRGAVAAPSTAADPELTQLVPERRR